MNVPIPKFANVLVKYIQSLSVENKCLTEVQQSIQDANKVQVFVHDHNNFIGYHRRYNDPSTIINVNEILDDNSIYLYPIEIRSTLYSLVNKMSFILSGKNHEYYFTDIIP
jgi:hypothetical protein